MKLVSELLRWGPHQGAHRAAVRCAVSVGVPMLAVLLLGRPDLFGAAAFGGFTAVFARDLPAPGRTKIQALTGGGLVASVAIGLGAAHLPGAPWTGSAVLVLLAGVAAVSGAMVQWRPPGPLFFVFAAGAYSAMPPASFTAAVQIVGVAAATAAFAVLVGSAGSLRPSASRGSRPLVLTGWREAWHSSSVLVVVGAAAGAAIVTGLSGVGHVYWAMLAAIVPAAVGHRGPWAVRGLHRALGTMVGVLVALPLMLAQLPSAGVVVAAVLLQLGAELVVLRNYGLAMVLITPLALLISGVGSTIPPLQLVGERLLATLIGVAVAFAVLGARSWFAGRSAPRRARA